MYFNVTWGAVDGGSGLSHYDVQYKVGLMGTWQGWLTDTLETSAPFLGVVEQTYYFKVSATDKVNNNGIKQSGPVTVKGVTKYYTLGGQRVAMRQGDVVYYLHGDHLGSTSLTTDQSGAVVAETRYLPYGQERWTSGATPTDFTFTGQRKEAGFGLMDYNARYYSQVLGRFVSADSRVPDPANPQSWNRYTYVHNNPLRYTDPSGHECNECGFTSQIDYERLFLIGFGGYAVAVTTIQLAEELKGQDPPSPLQAPDFGPQPGFTTNGSPDPFVYESGPTLGGEFTGPLHLPGGSTADLPDLGTGVDFPLGRPEVFGDGLFEARVFGQYNSQEAIEAMQYGTPRRGRNQSFKEPARGDEALSWLSSLYPHVSEDQWYKAGQTYEYDDYTYDIHWFEFWDESGDTIVEGANVRDRW